MKETIRTDRPRPSPDYAVCTQFLFMHLACLLAFWTGVSAAAVAVCLALYVVRMFAITAGFHRLFSHRSYRTGRLFQFLLAFAATAAYQKGPLWWAAHHRRHHLHVDTEEDLHSPVMRSLWQSHVVASSSTLVPNSSLSKTSTSIRRSAAGASWIVGAIHTPRPPTIAADLRRVPHSAA